MTAVLPALTSARGLLSMLDDPEPALQAHALGQLDELVDTFWSEIATEIPKM
jgi:26S proteasome regulatory subunit N2